MGEAQVSELLFLLAQRFTRENWSLCFPRSEELGLTPERLKVLKREGGKVPTINKGLVANLGKEYTPSLRYLCSLWEAFDLEQGSEFSVILQAVIKQKAGGRSNLCNLSLLLLYP